MSTHEAPTDEYLAPPPEELEQVKRRATAKRRRDSHIEQLMGSYGSRSCIWDLLTQSHQFKPLAVSDPLLLQRRVGVRDFGLALLNDLRRVCPDQLALAEREANDRANN